VAVDTLPGSGWRAFELGRAAGMPAAAVLAGLGSAENGLSSAEASARRREIGRNVLRSHGVRALTVLARQLRSYLLLLLVFAAAVSLAVGEQTEGIIIFSILGLSIGLGFLNEYRSERAVEALHSQIRRTTLVERDGRSQQVPVTELVPGDVLTLAVGDIVPADLRLLEAAGLECDESVLTGESQTSSKTAEPTEQGASPLDLPSCAFMGTIVRTGVGRGVVVRTGSRTVFGTVALRLGERHELTAFQQGLQSFSGLLAAVTAILAGSIFVINAALGRSILDSLLFSLAIAVGLTPQLLPAIVTVSLATGARRLAQRSVVVKRLVCIEDLGDIDVLFTDKTGTLTEGRISFRAALDAEGRPSPGVLELGLLCNEATVVDGTVVGGNQLDRALWEAPEIDRAALDARRRIGEAPFDYERQMASVLVEDPDGARLLVAKGSPEAIIARCDTVPAPATAVLERLFVSGIRVVATAIRPADGLSFVTPADETGLSLQGFLCFEDEPKADAASSLERLASLGIAVKVVTGDNPLVARKVCADLGLPISGTLTGADLARMSDDELREAMPATSIFARVTPEQKSRIIRCERSRGSAVGFLGDGVNDAIALHDADVGISVDSATDVAKDAADAVLLTKDLGILADGVVEGRRIFANTIKYVLMGTSSNFGNMFSAAGASLFLSFLPMLPTQILLNNLLYDASELTIPTDNVDEELLARPSHWDIGFIRRFMTFFGPLSSIYDFATFAVMLYVFDAGESLFQSGWFVESLATQTLVIFIIRTRRVPFFRSRPSRPLLVTTLVCAGVGVALPYSPLADTFGFTALPADFLAVLAGMVVTYLALAELGKRRFFRPRRGPRPLAAPRRPHERRVHRRAAPWTQRRRLEQQRRRPRPAARPKSRSARARA
jgi:Mg2+-importing ATPase